MEEKYVKLKEKVKSLEKKDYNLKITDLDDTIFCRKEQLEKSDILRNNRWSKWNEAIINQIGIENLIKDFYEWKEYHKCIVSLLDTDTDLILTAWVYDIQIAKVKALNLTHFNLIVVDEASEKIYETIRYTIEDIWFIPSLITIYEDRPNYFIENKEFIEDFLWTKIEIIYVEMVDNYTKVKKTKIA